MNTETVAKVVAALAEHDGLLTVTSATKSGINRTTLKRAADAGTLRRTRPGTYVDPAIPPKQLAMRGANLVDDAALSHRGGTYFWAMDGVDSLILEWSIPHHLRSSSPLVHRRRRFGDLEIVDVQGVRVTSPAQTLADLGAVCGADVVERAVESGLRLDLVSDPALRHFSTSDVRSRHGGAMLRSVLALRPPGARPTGSDVETIALQILRRNGLRPMRQWRVDEADGTLIGYVDFVLPPRALGIEIDGLETHDLKHRQHDYDRQRRIENRGFLVRRFTREDVLLRPKYMCAAIRDALPLAQYL